MSVECEHRLRHGATILAESGGATRTSLADPVTTASPSAVTVPDSPWQHVGMCLGNTQQGRVPPHSSSNLAMPFTRYVQIALRALLRPDRHKCSDCSSTQSNINDWARSLVLPGMASGPSSHTHLPASLAPRTNYSRRGRYIDSDGRSGTRPWRCRSSCRSRQPGASSCSCGRPSLGRAR